MLVNESRGAPICSCSEQISGAPIFQRSIGERENASFCYGIVEVNLYFLDFGCVLDIAIGVLFRGRGKSNLILIFLEMLQVRKISKPFGHVL